MFPDAHVLAPDQPVPPPGEVSLRFFIVYLIASQAREELTLSPDSLLRKGARKTSKGDESPNCVHGDQHDNSTDERKRERSR